MVAPAAVEGASEGQTDEKPIVRGLYIVAMRWALFMLRVWDRQNCAYPKERPDIARPSCPVQYVRQWYCTQRVKPINNRVNDEEGIDSRPISFSGTVSHLLTRNNTVSLNRSQCTVVVVASLSRAARELKTYSKANPTVQIIADPIPWISLASTMTQYVGASINMI